MSMEHRTSGNLDDTTLPKTDTNEWKQINISSQSMDNFAWEIVCDERWEDPQKSEYKCHRITRKALALGGYLYSVSTHISPNSVVLSPSVSESLIFVPKNDA